MIQYNKIKKVRLILIFIISILTLSANGQNKLENALRNRATGVFFRDSINNKNTADTIPTVEYDNAKYDSSQPAYYFNGKFINTIDPLRAVDPQSIDSIYIEHKEIEINNKKYYGQIYITMKKEYIPNLISLTDLKQKYTNLKNEVTVFMIDDHIIKENYDQYLVDEKDILKIIVDTIEMKDEKTTINVVRLLTRSKENIEESKKIYIRGLEI